jgi:hypothetical protein
MIGRVPIGAGVCFAGVLARVVLAPKREDRCRGWTFIEVDGVPGVHRVRTQGLALVARRYVAAKAWENREQQ